MEIYLLDQELRTNQLLLQLRKFYECYHKGEKMLEKPLDKRPVVAYNKSDR